MVEVARSRLLISEPIRGLKMIVDPTLKFLFGFIVAPTLILSTMDVPVRYWLLIEAPLPM